MTISIIGAPGSGKDTVALQILDKDSMIISGGEALREYVERKQEGYKQIQKTMDSGGLVDNQVLNRVLYQYLESKKYKNLIFSGTPRNKEQIKPFDDLLKKLESKLEYIFYLDVSMSTSWDRIKGRLYAPISNRTYHTRYIPPKVQGKDDETGELLIKRRDDNFETFKTRMRIFNLEKDAILSEYKKRGILHVIDGETTPEKIKKEILKILE